MRVTVTGGAGFVGSTLAEALLERGHEVTVLDDFSTGRRENLSRVTTDARARVIEGSILSRADVDSAIAGADAVVHLAAAVGVKLAMTRTVHTVETNVLGTSLVLTAAARSGALVLVASSSEVYGRSARVPFREDDAPMLGPTQSPRWAYACTKALDEWLALGLARERGLKAIICRLFNVAGPRQVGDYGMVLPRFVNQALAGAPLIVHGDGSQTRCFAHVREVAEALATLLETPAAIGEVINVGHNEEVSIHALAERVIRACDSRSPITTVSFEAVYGSAFQDLERRVPDVTKLTRLLGAPLSRGLNELIADTVAWARETLR